MPILDEQEQADAVRLLTDLAAFGTAEDSFMLSLKGDAQSFLRLVRRRQISEKFGIDQHDPAFEVALQQVMQEDAELLRRLVD